MSKKGALPDKRIAVRVAEAQGMQVWSGFSTAEMDNAWKALEWGRPFQDFSRFVYNNYTLWERVAQSHPYSALREALVAVDKAMAPSAAALLAERGLKHFYSMGPTPAVDKLLLENIVRKGGSVTYHPIDASSKAIKATLEEVTQHLNSAFGDGKWQEQIAFADAEPTDFSRAKSSGPSLVVYSGGTIMNNREFWQQAASLAQKGGVVVASTALTRPDEDMGDYWLSMYNTPEGKLMFEGGLKQSFPELFDKRNRGKWDVAFEHVPALPSFSKHEQYHTSRISIQLRVKDPVTLHFPDGTPISLRPTPTWSEAARWDWKEQRNHNYPIELAISTKPNLGEFMLTTPQDFGMKNLFYMPKAISYELNGISGLVASAAFTVDNPTANWHRMEKRGPPTSWQPVLGDNPQISHRK